MNVFLEVMLISFVTPLLVFVAVFVWHFFKVIEDIYYEQQAEIERLTRIKERQ